MNFLINTKYRTDKIEIMDDFSVGGSVLRDTLDKLQKINHWLGGNKVVINGIKKLLVNRPKNKELVIIDVGCGHGDILRKIANFGRKNKFKMKLIGIDANPHAIEYANELSINYPEITFYVEDIFSKDFEKHKFDIMIATLFFHHFKEDALVMFLKKALKNVKIGILINDLHRHKLAYYLFLFLTVFIKNKMIIEDGLTSVLRGFKRVDLIKMSEKLKVKPQILWKWAFRYQWIIQK